MKPILRYLSTMAVATALLATAAPVEAAVSEPSVPRSIRAVGGPHKVTITWQAPSSTGGSAITSYTAMIADSFNNQQSCLVADTVRTCVFDSGLVDFRPYYLTVKATNAIGNSINSPTVTATPYGEPAKPAIKYGYYDEATKNLTIRFYSKTPYPGTTFTVMANDSTVICVTTTFSCIQNNVVLHNTRDMSGANFAENLTIYQTIDGVTGPSFTGTQYLYKTGCTTGCNVGVVGNYLMVKNGSLAGANLANMSLYSSYFKDMNMSGMTITNTSFSGSSWWNVNFNNTTATNDRFLGNYWYNSSIDGATFTNDYWNSVSSLRVTGTPASLPGRVVLGRIVVPYAFLGGADMTNADLSHLDLSGIDFTWTNLTNANLNYSKAVSFFLNTNLSNTTFTGATLADSYTRVGASSAGITGTPATLPNKWTLTSGYLVGPGAYLANRVGISNLDLSNRDLRGIQLHTNVVANVNFSGSNLTGASFKDVTMSNVNFTGTNLSNANLSGARGTVVDTTLRWGLQVGGGILRIN